MKIRIGVSTLSFSTLLAMFDLDYESDPNGSSYLEREFGTPLLRPGDYEIYDSKDYGSAGLSRPLLQKLFPFVIPEDAQIWAEDLHNLRSAFFLIIDAPLSRTQTEAIRFTDEISVPDWRGDT